MSDDTLECKRLGTSMSEWKLRLRPCVYLSWCTAGYDAAIAFSAARDSTTVSQSKFPIGFLVFVACLHFCFGSWVGLEGSLLGSLQIAFFRC